MRRRSMSERVHASASHSCIETVVEFENLNPMAHPNSRLIRMFVRSRARATLPLQATRRDRSRPAIGRTRMGLERTPRAAGTGN
jgi:hypothetical protein